MNILYHHRTQGKGVERVHIMGIVEALRMQGHRVDTVSPPGVSLEGKGELADDLSEGKSSWKHLLKHIPGVVFEFLEIFYNVWAYFSLIKKVKFRSYDLIFERYAFLSFAGLLVAKRNGIAFFIEVNYTCRTPIFRERSRFIRSVERFIESIVLQRADGIVVVSSYLKTLLLAEGIPEEKIIVLPNAADPQKFYPEIDSGLKRAELNLHGKKVVGFIGYFYPWHGVEFFVNAYPGIAECIENVVFLLVGDGPLFDQLSESINNRQLNEKVRLVGRVPHRDIPQYISLFDVAVMPHSNDYGSPMKILEYMAMGKAVLAPRLGPLEDVIEDGVNGLLFAPKQMDSFKDKIVKVLSDERFLKRLGKAARQSVCDTHNWHNNASRIIELYRNTIPGNGTQS